MLKSSYLLSFLESLPEVSAKLNAPNTWDLSFDKAAVLAEMATVFVLVY